MNRKADDLPMTKELGLMLASPRNRARLTQGEMAASSPSRVLVGSRPFSPSANCRQVTGHSRRRSGGLYCLLLRHRQPARRPRGKRSASFLSLARWTMSFGRGC
jgi:hypothetical protein